MKNSMSQLFDREIVRRVFMSLLLLVPICSTAVAQVPDHERAALIALYDATQGWNWTKNTNWRNASDTDFRPPGTECGWYGISCLYNAARNVYQIYLPIGATFLIVAFWVLFG